MATNVFCLADSESQAVTIVSQLKSAGFADNDISVLFPDKTGTRDFAHEQHTKAPEGAVTGATTGGVLGGVVGLLAGIGALAIPGVGPLIAAGPIMATLSGIGVGAATGGLVGALVGMGIPELEAKRYEGKVKGGNILISTHCDDQDDVRAARDIFNQCGAKDIVTGGDASLPKADRADRPRGADASVPGGTLKKPTNVYNVDKDHPYPGV
ncbi:MAG TPA: hypothetical protein VD997_14810 [Phycisphaerales bacterium]|nr:hypothetical protein [Phycisphaerales bacterium]